MITLSSNNSMQRPALRAAADAERWADRDKTKTNIRGVSWQVTAKTI